MSVRYRVVLGFDVVATDVADAEKEVSDMIQAANSLNDLKDELIGLKIAEMPDGSKEDKPKS